MELPNLFKDERGVSPVIGVILMVAITVILAAVIGTFVLELGGSVSQTQPQASFGGDGGANTTWTLTHESGDTIDSDLTVIYTNTTGDQVTETWTAPADGISAGDSYPTSEAVLEDTTIRVVFESGGDSFTLAKIQTPN